MTILYSQGKYSPTQKIGILTRYKNKLTDIAASSNPLENLEVLLKEVDKDHKQMSRAGFQKAFAVLNTLNSIRSLDKHELKMYEEEIAESQSEAAESLSSAIQAFEKSIQRNRQKVELPETASVKKPKPVTKAMTSFGDLEQAFKAFEEEQKLEEAKELKKPSKKVENEFDVVRKFANFSRKAPSNPMNEKMRGVFHAPVLISGFFKVNNLPSNVRVHSISSGFFLMENMPVAYCESKLSVADRKKAFDKALTRHNKKAETSHIFPDTEGIFKNLVSENLSFCLAMPRELVDRMSIKEIRNVDFPWSRKTKKKVKHTRDDLINYISKHPKMLMLRDKSEDIIRKMNAHREKHNKAVLKESELSEQLLNLKKKWEQENSASNRIKLKDEMKRIEGEVKNLDILIDNHAVKNMKYKEKMRLLKEKKGNLETDLREEFVNKVKKGKA